MVKNFTAVLKVSNIIFKLEEKNHFLIINLKCHVFTGILVDNAKISDRQPCCIFI